VATWRRRPGGRFSVLVTMAGFAWFLPEWNSPSVPSALGFTFALAVSAACPALLAHALLRYPDRRPNGVERAAVVIGYVEAFVVFGLLPALLFDPHPQGCNQCPNNLLLVHGAEDAVLWVKRFGVWLGLVWAVAVAALAGRRLVASTAAMRRVMAPVVGPGIVYVGLIAWDYGHSLGRGFVSNDSYGRMMWAGQAVALSAVALGTSWVWVRGRRTRSALARLVVEVAAAPPPGGLGGVLRRMLGDPALAVLYPLPGGRLVDGRGQAAAAEPGLVVTPLLRGGRRVAVLAHHPGLLDDQALVVAIAEVCRLTLDNERLRAEASAQLADLRASLARIVEKADAERRRLERDLHDGAQQRLVSLTLGIRLTQMRLGSSTAPVYADRLEEAMSEVREVLAHLRRIAHGLYPAALADRGLAAGLEALAEQLTIPVALVSLPERRLDPSIEAAAYFVVAQSLKRSRCGRAAVQASCVDGRLILGIETDSAPPAELTDLEDRVGALDGRLTAERVRGSGTRIRVELPCVS